MKRTFLTTSLLAALFCQSQAQTNTFPTTGNVGIGTTSPRAGLHVTRANGSTAVILGNAYNHWTRFGSPNGGRIRSSGEGFLVVESEPDGSDNHLYLNLDSPGDILMVNGGGSVGIGTPANTARLEIAPGNDWTSNGWAKSVRLQAGCALQLTASATQKFGIGASTAGSLYFFTTGTEGTDQPADYRMVIDKDGEVGIGTQTPDAPLTVNGGIHAREVKVDLAGAVAPDFVFEDGYALKSLEEVKKYVDKHGHLPEIPSAAEMAQNGIELKAMNLKLLQKIEELTLYLFEQQDTIERLSEEVAELKTSGR